MKTSTIVWIIVVIVVLLGGWYFLSSSGSNTATTTTTDMTASTTDTTAATPQPQGTVVLATSTNQTFGDYLVSADTQMTLYTFDKDSNASSTCYAQCAANWPALTVPAGTTQLAGLPGMDSSDLAMITRTDGSLQVTYKGKPLYFYVKDAKPGDVTGDNVGNVWHVAKP